MKSVIIAIVLVSLGVGLGAQEPKPAAEQASKPVSAPQETPKEPAKATEPGAAPAGQKQEPKPVTAEAVAAKLTGVQAALNELLPLGKTVTAELGNARRAQKVKAVVPLIKAVEKELGKLEPKAADPGKEVLAAKAAAFSERLADALSVGEAGIEPVEAAASGAEGSWKDLLTRLRDQLYIQVALQEIGTYVKGDRVPGTFDNMFPKTARYGRKGASAFLAIFGDESHRSPVRQLAGEGVAQTGSKDDLPKVKEISADTLEAVEIREKAKEVVARLGDRTDFDKDLAKLDDKLKETMEKLAKAEEKVNELGTKARELNAVVTRTPEQDEQLKTLQKDFEAEERQRVDLTYTAGIAWNNKAAMYQGVRDHAKTEECYRKSIDVLMRIGAYLSRNERARSTMNIGFYNLACVQSLQNKVDEAAKSLDWAFRWGYTEIEWAHQDGDLTNLRKSEKFKALIDEVKSGKAKERWKREADEQRKKMEGEGGTEKPAGDPKGPPAGEKKPEGGEKPPEGGEKKG